MNLSMPVIIIIAVVIACGLFKAFLSDRSPGWTAQYVRADMFNSSEHAFLLSLRRAAPPHIAVLAKVRVADLISPARRDIAAFNRIARKHVDFVLYHLQSRQVLMAIELDGPTHTSKRSQASDKLKNAAFASAGIRLVRVPLAGSEKAETVRSFFREFEAAVLTAQASQTGTTPTSALPSKHPLTARRKQ
jgi:very-short-patch-repair endonuclease